jgi:hypothetical protein
MTYFALSNSVSARSEEITDAVQCVVNLNVLNVLLILVEELLVVMIFRYNANLTTVVDVIENGTIMKELFFLVPTKLSSGLEILIMDTDMEITTMIHVDQITQTQRPSRTKDVDNLINLFYVTMH